MGHEEIAKARREGLSNRELVKMYRGIDLPIDPPEFKIYSSQQLNAAFYRAGESSLNTIDGDPAISGITSSTDVDLYNSRMTKRAIGSMLKDCKTHLTTFLNHDYEVPESILGSVLEARTTTRLGEDGHKYTDLDILSSVVGDDVNPRAMKCWRAIRSGVKLGWSIGALIIEWEWQQLDGTSLQVDYDDPWAMYFPPTEDAVLAVLDVLLLESSIVGMPANRRSWASDAARSISLAARRYQATHKGIYVPETVTKEESMSGDKARAAASRKAENTATILTNATSTVPSVATTEVLVAGITTGTTTTNSGNISFTSTDIYTAPDTRNLHQPGVLDYGDVATPETPEPVASPEDAPQAVPESAVPVTREATSDTGVASDPWEMVVRALDLALKSGREISRENIPHVLEAHDRSAHVLNMHCCGVNSCVGHDADEDLSGRFQREEAMHDDNGGTSIDVEYSLEDLHVLKKEFGALKDAHAHITDQFTEQIQSFKLQVELSRAEAENARQEIKRLNEIPVGGRPTQQAGTEIDHSSLNYDDRVALAREQTPTELIYSSNR